MAAQYFARERFFTGTSPNVVSPTVVFMAEDLTLDECNTLVDSVGGCLSDLNVPYDEAKWHFELASSAEDDPAAHVRLKGEWLRMTDYISEAEISPKDSWWSDFHMLHQTASDHADIVREMRSARIPTIFLQFDDGHGFATFDCVNSLTFDEIETLKAVLAPELNQMGFVLRIVSDWHAEREPSVYLQAKRQWQLTLEEMDAGALPPDEKETRKLARFFVEEIERMRQRPLVFEPADEVVDEPKLSVSQGNDESAEIEQLAADESHRTKYQDPDNYWRNVWLYELRKEGRTNADILRALAARSTEFAPIETDNALRSAIEAIARYHRWPALKGRAGRPRTRSKSDRP